MTTPMSDFDAAKAIGEILKSVPRERQERILRWVAESLGLHSPTPSHQQASQVATLSQPAAPQPAHAGEGLRRATDIKSFVDSKKPKSDMQFAAVVAYYHRFEAPELERRETIDADALQEATRLAGRKRLVKPHMTLVNAKNQGYLDKVGAGQFRVNTVGENLVAMTLPGDNAERKQVPRRPSPKKAKKKARIKGRG